MTGRPRNDVSVTSSPKGSDDDSIRTVTVALGTPAGDDGGAPIITPPHTKVDKTWRRSNEEEEEDESGMKKSPLWSASIASFATASLVEHVVGLTSNDVDNDDFDDDEDDGENDSGNPHVSRVISEDSMNVKIAASLTKRWK